ncbi:hypothetical protein DFH07DRAFT_770582 [Mycena maculata]|uniref:Uncharacterized protein n=1 Tax=Mycena maculata TaxID=230809 RepID=A0AAD7JG29_9AGAR|nr:hypothetical protein DFH07DRAFT_770582 [Mycena maculata]
MVSGHAFTPYNVAARWLKHHVVPKVSDSIYDKQALGHQLGLRVGEHKQITKIYVLSHWVPISDTWFKEPDNSNIYCIEILYSSLTMTALKRFNRRVLCEYPRRRAHAEAARVKQNIQDGQNGSAIHALTVEITVPVQIMTVWRLDSMVEVACQLPRQSTATPLPDVLDLA